MTPAFHRRKAARCRRIAAANPGTIAAGYLTEQAEQHEKTAALLVELHKIDAALSRAKQALARNRETLH
jgi:hypothetical protein